MMYAKVFRRTAALLFMIIGVVFAGLMPEAAAADASSAAGRVTAPGALTVRASAGTSGAALTWLPSGSYVTLMSKSGNWWYVEYAPSRYGYAGAGYIQTVAGTYIATVSSAVSLLNVRSGPGTSYSVVGTLPSGRTVLVLAENGGWNRILCNGTLVGYASAAYLTSASSAMTWPVPASQKINQYYGGSHDGLDIGASVRGVSGDRVVASAEGKVVFAGVLGGYGNVVYINSVVNGQLIQTRYSHLSSWPLVAAGSYVSKGQLIGYMGNTGTSSGVHLHFEVRIRNSTADCLANANSAPVNPLNYV